ncbi:hypothetical protein EG68_05764, partial [Paragonimus skrjabini miyazakii]
LSLFREANTEVPRNPWFTRPKIIRVYLYLKAQNMSIYSMLLHALTRLEEHGAGFQAALNESDDPYKLNYLSESKGELNLLSAAPVKNTLIINGMKSFLPLLAENNQLIKAIVHFRPSVGLYPITSCQSMTSKTETFAKATQNKSGIVWCAQWLQTFNTSFAKFKQNAMRLMSNEIGSSQPLLEMLVELNNHMRTNLESFESHTDRQNVCFKIAQNLVNHLTWLLPGEMWTTQDDHLIGEFVYKPSEECNEQALGQAVQRADHINLAWSLIHILRILIVHFEPTETLVDQPIGSTLKARCSMDQFVCQGLWKQTLRPLLNIVIQLPSIPLPCRLGVHSSDQSHHRQSDDGELRLNLPELETWAVAVNQTRKLAHRNTTLSCLVKEVQTANCELPERLCHCDIFQQALHELNSEISNILFEAISKLAQLLNSEENGGHCRWLDKYLEEIFCNPGSMRATIIGRIASHACALLTLTAKSTQGLDTHQSTGTIVRSLYTVDWLTLRYEGAISALKLNGSTELLAWFSPKRVDHLMEHVTGQKTESRMRTLTEYMIKVLVSRIHSRLTGYPRGV